MAVEDRVRFGDWDVPKRITRSKISLIGIYGAFRQSELSGLTIEQAQINPAGVAFELAR